MKNTQTCPRCLETKPLDQFSRRAKSLSGYAAACKECTRKQHWIDYHGDPVQNERQRARVKKSKEARFNADPAYKRAFNIWGSSKRRTTKMPPWVCILDFVPICREAIEKGPEYEVDHIIPLRGELVSGLHVPGNVRVVRKEVNQAKRNKYDPAIDDLI
jgi:hypothetical protein